MNATPPDTRHAPAMRANLERERLTALFDPTAHRGAADAMVERVLAAWRQRPAPVHPT